MYGKSVNLERPIYGRALSVERAMDHETSEISPILGKKVQCEKANAIYMLVR